MVSYHLPVAFADVNTRQIFGANSHNFIGGNPNLGPLQDNGSPTLTRAPLVGSPVIDAGNDSAPGEPTSDQRGLPRKFSTHVDIGAVELPVGLVRITGSAPSTIPEKSGVTFTVTLTVGDDIRYVAVTDDFSGLSYGVRGSGYTLPSGWTATQQDGDLTFHSPGFGTGTGLVTPGIYTFAVYVPSDQVPGSVLTDQVTVLQPRDGGPARATGHSRPQCHGQLSAAAHHVRPSVRRRPARAVASR